MDKMQSKEQSANLPNNMSKSKNNNKGEPDNIIMILMVVVFVIIGSALFFLRQDIEKLRDRIDELELKLQYHGT